MRTVILRSLGRVVKALPSVGEMIKTSEMVWHASHLLSSSPLGLSLEEREVLLQLLSVLVRCKIELNDEEGILSSAMKLEEESNAKEEELMEEAEEEIDEKEREKWEGVGREARELIRALLKKKGETLSIGTMLEDRKAKESAEKREQEATQRAKEAADKMMEAEKEKKNLENKLAAVTKERDGLKKEISNKKKKAEEVNRKMQTGWAGDKRRLTWITTLSTIRVFMLPCDDVVFEGNRIIHHGPTAARNIIIGKILLHVCIHVIVSIILYRAFIQPYSKFYLISVCVS